MPEDSEWYGEPHVLIVRELRLPDWPLDDGAFTDYDIEHPPTCKQEESYGGHVLDYACDIACMERECLPFALRYSGTPITEPGTYRIQGWGRKSYCRDYGAYEYDTGVGVMDPGDGGMSQALADYVTAMHRVELAVAWMRLCELKLADDNSSALAVNKAQDALVLAARDLTRATGELPRERRPKGWES